MVRKAIELQYKGTCTITEYQAVKDEVTKRTSSKEVDVLVNQPCKLSFETIKSTNQTESGAELAQATKLFIAPEITVKPGSKITVTQNGVTTAYKNSGEPAVYSNHQEIRLELFERWS